MIQKKLEEMFPDAKEVQHLGHSICVLFEEYEIYVCPRRPELPWLNVYCRQPGRKHWKASRLLRR